MTAVEWLIEQIKNDQNQKALTELEWMKIIEQAKEMEKWQRIKFEIPELSDEEIDLGFEDYKAKNKEYKLGNAKGHIWYLACKWYREQLKQRQ